MNNDLSTFSLRCLAAIKRFCVFSRASASRQKALLIGIAYTPLLPTSHNMQVEWQDLHRTHDDVKAFKRFLMDHCSFEEENIIVMLDTEDTPPELKPTKQNIICQMRLLRKNVRSGDSLVFQFAGHGTLVKDKTGKANKAMVPMDYNSCIPDQNLILAHVVRDILVAGFPLGAKLTMLFDCCHSQSMAGLKHSTCNRVVGSKHKFKRAIKAVQIMLHFLGRKNTAVSIEEKSFFVNLKMKLFAFKTQYLTMRNTVNFHDTTCNGWCLPCRIACPDIVSLSACRDDQLTMECDGEEGTLTQAVIRACRSYPSLTYNQVLCYLRHKTEVLADQIHEYKHHYRQNSIPLCKTNSASYFSSGSCTQLDCTRMARNKYGWEPQLSSEETLDMNGPFSFRLLQKT